MRIADDNPNGPPALLTDSPEAPILRLQQVSKTFGGVQALKDISFEVSSGAVMGLIGPNGAGKTTLFNLISGIFAPDGGRILYRGSAIGGRPTHQLVADGIARTFQNVELFESLTAVENVMVGQFVRTRCGFWGAWLRGPGVRREERDSQAAAVEWLRFVGLAGEAQTPSGELPFGWQRLLEIARALASHPRLLLLDEPAAGLNAVETEQLGRLILDIRERGTTILLVEHDMSLTMEVCDQIVVLDRGEKLAEGTPREIQTNVEVLSAYLGQDMHAPPGSDSN
jgi:branched-chain amino acid transport system ATP-binding protein